MKRGPYKRRYAIGGGRARIPTFDEQAECILITLKESLIKMGHHLESKLVGLIDEALATRP
jgi:hypothetical protein